MGFQPFYCVQELKEGKPWIGFIFVYEVEPGVGPKAQPSEAKDPKWMQASDVQELLETSSERFFTLELRAWEYYFSQKH